MRFTISTLVSAASVISVVSAHALVTAVQGANEVTTPGFANVASTPRNTGNPLTAEGDTSVIRGQDCGKTADGGKVNVANEMAAIASDMPTVGANGLVTATIHQVNQDGAGPFKFEVSPSGDMNDWVEMTASKNVPGAFLGLSTAVAKDWPVEATIPAGTKCTGGQDGATCLIRAKNATPAGPFGSCFAVTQGAGGGAAGNTTTTAAAAKKAARRDASGRFVKKEQLGPLKRRYGDMVVSWERWVEKK